MKNRLINIIFVILIVVFVLTGVLLAVILFTRNGYEKDFKKIAESAPPVQQVVTEPEPAINYLDELRLQNPDTWCFVTIPGTQINYPVMRTPSDRLYYLRRDFYKNYSYYGTPFAETRFPFEGDYKIIYGHHIRGDKMFGELINYNTQSYFNSHNKVYLYTQSGVEEYTTFASVYTNGDDPHKLYARPINGIISAEEFSKYIIDVYEYSTTCDWNNIPSYGDEILILSTCEYSKTDGRYMLFAYKKPAA